MNFKNNYIQSKNGAYDKNGGYISLIILFVIVLAGVYYMAVQIENNQKGTTQNEDQKNAIDSSLDITNEAQLRADMINNESY